MKVERWGYIDLWEYNDIFQLVEDQHVMSWCSESLKNEIIQLKKTYFALLHSISDEWGNE